VTRHTADVNEPDDEKRKGGTDHLMAEFPGSAVRPNNRKAGSRISTSAGQDEFGKQEQRRTDQESKLVHTVLHRECYTWLLGLARILGTSVNRCVVSERSG